VIFLFYTTKYNLSQWKSHKLALEGCVILFKCCFICLDDLVCFCMYCL